MFEFYNLINMTQRMAKRAPIQPRHQLSQYKAFAVHFKGLDGILKWTAKTLIRQGALLRSFHWFCHALQDSYHVLISKGHFLNESKLFN